MPPRYSDTDIQRFIDEKKPLGDHFFSRFTMKDKRGHRERDIDVTGESGSRFRLILRQSKVNPLNFSLILAVFPMGSNQPFHLLRYNGKTHAHANRIEDESFYEFHIHRATERYQDRGMEEEAYAEATDRFNNFDSALVCLLEDGNFNVPDKLQLDLFRGR